VRIGIDEAGVGPMAGPLVISAVIIEDGVVFPKLVRDSKKLSSEQRESLIDDIHRSSSCIITKIIPPALIDAKGIWRVWDAVVIDIIRACRMRSHGRIMVDGNRVLGEFKNVFSEPKADDRYVEVSAASIIAKYTQTCFMDDLHDLYPQYGFRSHNGYPTSKHRRALEVMGPTPEHRISYGSLRAFKPTKKFLRGRNKNIETRIIGL
jgi:ribonuclease HII